MWPRRSAPSKGEVLRGSLHASWPICSAEIPLAHDFLVNAKHSALQLAPPKGRVPQQHFPIGDRPQNIAFWLEFLYKPVHHCTGLKPEAGRIQNKAPAGQSLTLRPVLRLPGYWTRTRSTVPSRTCPRAECSAGDARLLHASQRVPAGPGRVKRPIKAHHFLGQRILGRTLQTNPRRF